MVASLADEKTGIKGYDVKNKQSGGKRPEAGDEPIKKRVRDDGPSNAPVVDELDPSQESVLFGVEPSQTLPANAMPDEDIMPSIETLISMITSVPIIRVDINKPFA